MSYFLFYYLHLVQAYLLKKIPRDGILLILGEWVDVSIAQVSYGRKNSELKDMGLITNIIRYFTFSMKVFVLSLAPPGKPTAGDVSSF